MNNVWLLSFVSFFTDMGTYMVTPLIPIFLASSGPMIIGVIDGVSEALTSLLKFVSGYVSDRSKKRKSLAILGYGLSGIGRIFLVIASSWVGVFVWKLIDRTGKGIRTAPRDAIISEAGGKRKQGRSFGLHQMMDMLGAAIGIGIAYLLLTMDGNKDFHSVFLYSLIPVGIGFCLLFAVKEKRENTKVISREPKAKPSWKKLNRETKQLLLIIMLFTVANSSNSFLLLRATDLGISATSVLLLYLVLHLVASLFSYTSGAISDRFGHKVILTVGYILYGFVYIGFGMVSSVTGLWLLFILYGFYIALTKGIEKSLVASSAPKDLKATSLGMYSMVTGIGLLPASLLTG
ncbi:MFS transporter [Brevibacillus porteri]|uniref:MFS transporter n=1 Tax=Brevibacillus porteri TaxID=2126350 RepID=UPI00037444D2